MFRDILCIILLIFPRVTNSRMVQDGGFSSSSLPDSSIANGNEDDSNFNSSQQHMSSSEFEFKMSIGDIRKSELLRHVINTSNIDTIQNGWNNKSSADVQMIISCQESTLIKSMISKLKNDGITHEEISQCGNQHLLEIQTDGSGLYKLLYHNVIQSIIDLMIFWKKYHGIFLIDHYSGIQENQLRRYLRQSIKDGKFDIIMIESKFDFKNEISKITREFYNFIIICDIPTTTNIIEQAISDNRFNEINAWIIVSPNVPDVLLSTLISSSSLVTVLAYKFSKLNSYVNKNKDALKETLFNFDLTKFEQHPNGTKLKPSINLLLKPEDKIAQELTFTTEIEMYDVFYTYKQKKIKYIKFAKWNPFKGLQVFEFFEPEDNIEKLGGRTVRIAGFVHLPYVSIDHKSDGKPVFTGYMWDMIVMLMAYFNANTTYEAQSKAIWGILLNGSYTGLLNRLYKKEVDVSMNGYSKLLDRSAVLNYLAPMAKIDFSMTYQTPQAYVSPTTYLDPFSYSVWILIFITMIITTIALALAMLWSPEWELYDIPSVDVHSKQFRILSWTFMEEALEDPPGISARIIFGAVLIGTMGSFILYTSVFTSFLAAQDSKLPITTIQDLIEDREYATVIVGSTIYENIVRNAQDGIYKKFWETKLKKTQEFSLGKSIHDGVRKMLDDLKVVFVGDGPSIIKTMDNNCSVAVVRTKLMRDDLYMVTRSDFPYSRIFYIRMLRIQEGGIMNRLGITYHIVRRPPCDTGVDSATSSFGIQQVVGLFILLFCGIVLTVIITVIECYINNKTEIVS